MNSVLLIGNHSFTTGVITQVRGLDSLTVTIATSAEEALPLMAKAPPDVLIVQACGLREGSITKTFSIERPSTYFVIIEDAFLGGLDLSISTQHVPGHSAEHLPETTPERTPEAISALHLEETAFALEAGADAYLWLPPIYSETRYSEQSASDPDQLSAAALDMPTPDVGKGHLKLRAHVVQPSVKPIALHPSQRRLIQAHIQIGLNRAQRYRDLSRINDWLSAVALVDALTQLNNRRSFDLELPQKIKVARAKGAPLSLMVIDIDRFKSVNDRYGHLVGDDVLKMLAKRLLNNMRFYDTPFRYGGEEFVVTLSNTDLAEGIAIAQRLRHSIADPPFKINPNISTIGKLSLTVSIGLTELKPDDDDRGRSCLHRADQHLLRAKAGGRNRVVSD